MPRARNIKPGFFTNDELAECSPLARLLFIGLWTLSDREGRLNNRPKRIKAEVLPFDECDVSALINELEQSGFLVQYESFGHKLIQINNFGKHQRPHHNEQKSTIPAPSTCDQGKKRLRPRRVPLALNVDTGYLNVDTSDQRVSGPDENDVGSEANDLLRLLGNPDDAKFVWQVGWLVAAGDLTKAVAVDAAAGPRAVGGVGNPVGYFRRSLENAVGDEALASLLSKVPRFDPEEAQPMPFAFELASALALTEEP